MTLKTIIRVTALLYLLVAGFSLVRFARTLAQWSFLDTLPLSVPPLYLALTGLVWGLAALGVVYGLWMQKGWAPRYALGFTTAYFAYIWLDRAIFAANPLSNVWFLAGTHVFILLFLWIAYRDRRIQTFFSERAHIPPQ
jgi:hypothetical protein